MEMQVDRIEDTNRITVASPIVVDLKTLCPALTKRERHICRMLLQGKTNKAIAGSLGRSHRTIEDHRRTILRKMGAPNIVALCYKVCGSPYLIG